MAVGQCTLWPVLAVPYGIFAYCACISYALLLYAKIMPSIIDAGLMSHITNLLSSFSESFSPCTETGET